MRKAVKIKTWLMLLSWMVIFLHGVIPHNHYHDHNPGCHNLVHNSSASHHHQDCDHSDKEPLFENNHQADSEIICHFDARLFQNILVDNFFIAESGWHSHASRTINTRFISPAPDLVKPPAFISCLLLRAPPYKA